MSANQKTHRYFKGFAALDDQGRLVWASLRIKEADSLYYMQHHNPDFEGTQPDIREVEIKLFD